MGPDLLESQQRTQLSFGAGPQLAYPAQSHKPRALREITQTSGQSLSLCNLSGKAWHNFSLKNVPS